MGGLRLTWAEVNTGRDRQGPRSPGAEIDGPRHFTKEENRDFSAFQFTLQLMLEQALTNLIVYLMISQKLHTKVEQMS